MRDYSQLQRDFDKALRIWVDLSQKNRTKQIEELVRQVPLHSANIGTEKDQCVLYPLMSLERMFNKSERAQLVEFSLEKFLATQVQRLRDESVQDPGCFSKVDIIYRMAVQDKRLRRPNLSVGDVYALAVSATVRQPYAAVRSSSEDKSEAGASAAAAHAETTLSPSVVGLDLAVSPQRAGAHAARAPAPAEQVSPVRRLHSSAVSPYISAENQSAGGVAGGGVVEARGRVNSESGSGRRQAWR